MAKGKRGNRTNHKTPRVSGVEYRRRVLQVADMLQDGYGPSDILKSDIVRGRKEENGKEAIKGWGITIQQLMNYVRRAWKDIESFQIGNLQEKKVKAIAERDRLKLRCIAKKDYAAAIRVIDSRDKIEGILADTIKHTGNVGYIIPEDEKNRLLEAAVVALKKRNANG